MGSFSNGTEGALYQERYCNRCVHDVNEDCPVWLMHLVHNYQPSQEMRSMMDQFIPRETVRTKLPNGKVHSYKGNGQCKMFVPREGN